jgi:NAD(P)-dependent dehydrogenase (short-subunit alcohol dehydrogenase family)
MTERLDGRVALVTGAGRGLGAAVARRLAAAGAAVVVNDFGVTLEGAVEDEQPAAAVVREITEAGGSACIDTGDVSDFDAAKAMVDLAVEQFGKLDIVVNVAGIIRDRMLWNMTPDEWDAVIRVHMRGSFNTSRHAATLWRELGDADNGRRIINFISTGGLFGAIGQPNYAAAKMGMVGLTYSCANALARMGATCNALAPAASTRMTGAPVDDAAAVRRSPENVATVVQWLAGPRAAWCNGQVVSARGFDVSLYALPRPIARLRNDGPWDITALADLADEEFRPLLDGASTWPPVELLPGELAPGVAR